MGHSDVGIGHKKITTSDGESLYCQWQRIDRAKAVILIVHGVGEHIGRYKDFEAWFCNNGYTCYGYDQRGHGLSDGRRGHVSSFVEYASDLELIISMVNKEEPTLPVFLFSHSMGTLVALMHSELYPQNYKGIILSSCAIKLGLQFPDWVTQSISKISRLIPGLRVPTFISADNLTHDPVVVDNYKNDRLIVSKVTLGWVTSFYQAQKDIIKNSYNIEIPLLALHSQADRVTSIEGIREFLSTVKSKDTTLIEYQTLYHELHNEMLDDKDGIFNNISAWCNERL